MIKRNLIFSLVASVGLSTLLLAGIAGAQEPQTDKVSEEAAKFEAELGKFKDTSPEAAEILVKLVDLYHADARAFGLIRAGQKFVAAHPTDARHKAVMLKLIDGLEAMSRNKDLVVAVRQFLTRYPEAPECAALEPRLAGALTELNDLPRAADAYRAIWQRQGATEAGRDAGIQAITRYSAVGSAASITTAAELCEEMLDKLPAGEFTKFVGLQGVYEWRRINLWAKSNLAGAKLLKKGVPIEPEVLRELHRVMAEQHMNLGQRMNAVESLRAARAIRDDWYVHYYLIENLFHGNAKPADLEPLVNEYLAKYPERPDRFSRQSHLAHAYLKAGDKPRALQMIGALLPFDAYTNASASVLVQNIGVDPPQLAEAERLLREGLAKNKDHAWYLRYVMAFELFRDKMKDPAKVRQTLLELVTLSPTDDAHTAGAVDWLLTNAATEADFKADVTRIIAARREHAHLAALRNALPNWQKTAAANKDLKAKADFLKAEIDKQNADPILQAWSGMQGVSIGADEKLRLQLLDPANLAKQNEAQLNILLYNQAYYLRHYAPGDRRVACGPAYAAYSKAFPKDYTIATLFLVTATDYGPVPLMKEGAEKLLTFEPQANDSDLWRRLMIAADQNKDADLVKRAFNWILKSQEKFGKEPGYASTIGDTLVKYNLEAEAQAYWLATVKLNRNYAESRDCALRLLPKVPPNNKLAFIKELFSHSTDFQARYAQWLAAEYFAAADVANFEAVLREARKRQIERPFRALDVEPAVLNTWVDATRASATLAEPDKLRIYAAIRDLQAYYPSAGAELAILELTPPDPKQPINRLLAYQRATRMLGNEAYDWDRLAPFAQAALGKKDYVTAATLVTGMLANITNAGEDRYKAGRDMVAQSYARMGAVGLTIDESSPLAPLLQAALYLRLGDERLAYDTYVANKALFDQNRNECPVDVVIFVCERLLGAGGDDNHEYVETTLRGWLVKHSESQQHEAATKAQIQILLAKNYYKAQRYDVARTEYTTVINRYPGTREAIEAEFGIGETFLSQKVYDQAEQVFEKLATSKDLSVVVRAEFLRGVLAFRRGDHEEARDIFRGVLERVPSVELANQALYNLSEVYGAEERYLDQLNMLRTVGRLGGASKRRHAPGQPLSIVVHDGDLGISRGHNRIPVIVTTEPGGDKETVYLTSAGAGKGLFRVDLDTRLGNAQPGDKVLQLTGKDIIKCDYPAEFKAEFKTVPLSDVEIRVASNAKFEVSSSKVIDQKEETFSQRLEREEREAAEGDKRVSQGRPSTQVKPGNLIYLRVQDADRDLSDEADKIVVKLSANSGDQVQATVVETGPHTGIFEGSVKTGELPAGALASDAAIDHNALMTIDRDPKTYWSSLPDGATPKSLTVDMKDLRNVARVKLTSPKAGQNSPVRGTLLGSYDGRFWFRLASNPAQVVADPVGEFGKMKRRAFEGNFTGFADWKEVVNLAKNSKPFDEAETDEINWARTEEEKEKVGKLYAVIWHGKIVQPREGAARIAVQGTRTALSLDGRLEMPLGVGGRTVDVWLEAGTHDITIFSASATGEAPVSATWARADLNVEQVTLMPFRPSDFDLEQPVAKRKAAEAVPSSAVVAENAWEFRFKPIDLRFVRFVCEEYVGEALHIGNVEVGGRLPNQIYIPTESDVLSLAANDTLEIAGGDVVTATYTDEFTASDFSSSQLLEHKLTATYYNASIGSIAYDLDRSQNGAVTRQRKELLRVDPGERVVIEIVDYDEDRTDGRDTVKFQVMVNEGEPVELVATETEEFTGIFTKELDTSPKTAEGKFTVKQGDRIYVRYFDTQNTFPGHSVPRETVVFVNEPSAAQVRVYESRIEHGPAESKAPPRTVYLPPPDGKPASGVALEAPLTVEVIDPDAAKDSRSSVVVNLVTTDGAKVQVRCVVSGAFDELSVVPGVPTELQNKTALEEGRFVGQVILQLGGKSSPGEVPLTAEMPRQLVGGPVMDEETGPRPGESLVTRVLNVTGKDIISATYKDERRPDGAPPSLESKARLIVNGQLAITDREYEKEADRLHVGEKLFLRVLDADRDSTDERDSVTVEISTQAGEKERVELIETVAHSGVFTGSLMLKASDKPVAGNLKPEDPAVEVYFGDTLAVTYLDKLAGTERGELSLSREVPIVIGTNGLVLAFTKTFNDETLAVETKFHMAESFFELFKSHKGLGRDEDQKGDLESGRRILREVMEDYPDPKYAPRVAYLLGQFAQELAQWDEAVASYELIIRQYPDHTLAADAQYKLAQSHEEAGDFDKALEAYVTLAATYPKSPLIASVMIRISDHFYKKETYDVAAQVGEKFLERFAGNPNAPRMAFRIGQCYYKAKKYKEAADSFDRFAKIFPDDKLASQSLFWSGESFRMANNNPLAFQRYNRCRWDFPSSEAAKYARGRLALPEMLQQFESAANDLDQ